MERFPIETSREVAELVTTWMPAAGIVSIFGLHSYLDVDYTTVYRWLTGRTRLPISAAVEIIGILADLTQSDRPRRSLEEIIARTKQSTKPKWRLRAELKSRGICTKVVMEAIRAARLHLVEDEEPIRYSEPLPPRG